MKESLFPPKPHPYIFRVALFFDKLFCHRFQHLSPKIELPLDVPSKFCQSDQGIGIGVGRGNQSHEHSSRIATIQRFLQLLPGTLDLIVFAYLCRLFLLLRVLYIGTPDENAGMFVLIASAQLLQLRIVLDIRGNIPFAEEEERPKLRVAACRTTGIIGQGVQVAEHLSGTLRTISPHGGGQDSLILLA